MNNFLESDLPARDYISQLNESGLSIIVNHIKNHDTGTLTAFRDQYSKKENRQRNASLKSKLNSLGYGITSVDGIYVENYNTPEAIEVKEDVFFVVDIKGKGNLEKDLRNIGEEFDQDSILFIPKGGQTSYLIGTNHVSDYPGYGKKETFPIFKPGNEGEFMTKVKGRPFIFSEKIIKEYFHYVSNNSGKFLANRIANKDWRNLIVEEE